MGKTGDNSGVGLQIKLLLERAERLRAEQKELKADENDVYNEGKSRGFDVKMLKRLIKLRAMDPDKRREDAALEEIYKAAVGMGDGSLSDLARAWLAGKRPGEDDDAGGAAGVGLDAPPERGGPKPVDADFGSDLSDKPLTVEDATRLGAEAAKAGRPVTSNPFKAGDERRAAWDEAWCSALGSDGMDIPAELRPTEKPKKGDDKPADGQAADPAAGAGDDETGDDAEDGDDKK